MEVLQIVQPVKSQIKNTFQKPYFMRKLRLINVHLIFSFRMINQPIYSVLNIDFLFNEKL